MVKRLEKENSLSKEAHIRVILLMESSMDRESTISLILEKYIMVNLQIIN